MDDQSKQVEQNTKSSDQTINLQSAQNQDTQRVNDPKVPETSSKDLASNSPSGPTVTGSSDNLGGYTTKTFKDYLGSDKLNIPSANSVTPTNPSEESFSNQALATNTPFKAKPLLLAVVLVVIIIGLVLAHHFDHKAVKKGNSSSIGSSTQSNINDTTKALQNPLNNSQQVNSQIKYCTSSPLAADVAC
jgi:hypothetical protein